MWIIDMIWTLYLVASLGILSSLYAWYIHFRHLRNPEYESICDINEEVNCTKVVTGKYGTIFSIPNSIWGFLYYSLILMLSYHNLLLPIFWLSILSVLGSIYLGYILYFKLRQMCILCTLVYVLNVAMFVIAYMLMN